MAGITVGLSVRDRLLLLHTLPQEGDILTLKIVTDLKADLGFSEQEIAELKMKVDAGQVKWDGDRMKSVTFGPKAFTMIGDTLRRLSDEKKLGIDFVRLYDQFVTES